MSVFKGPPACSECRVRKINRLGGHRPYSATADRFHSVHNRRNANRATQNSV